MIMSLPKPPFGSWQDVARQQLGPFASPGLLNGRDIGMKPCPTTSKLSSWIRVTRSCSSTAAFNYADLRKFEAALKLFDRALDILPNDPDVMAFKAGVYQGEGNLEEAAKLLRDVNAETPSLVVFATKITQLTLERNLSEAVRLLQARVAQYHFGSELEKGAFTGTLAFTQRLAGDNASARITAEQARNTLEPICKNQPDNGFALHVCPEPMPYLGRRTRP